jgi:hypothetical protein
MRPERCSHLRTAASLLSQAAAAARERAGQLGLRAQAKAAEAAAAAQAEQAKRAAAAAVAASLKERMRERALLLAQAAPTDGAGGGGRGGARRERIVGGGSFRSLSHSLSLSSLSRVPLPFVNTRTPHVLCCLQRRWGRTQKRTDAKTPRLQLQKTETRSCGSSLAMAMMTTRSQQRRQRPLLEGAG